MRQIQIRNCRNSVTMSQLAAIAMRKKVAERQVKEKQQIEEQKKQKPKKDESG